jgi:hypothetical protein
MRRESDAVREMEGTTEGPEMKGKSVVRVLGKRYKGKEV